MTDIITLRCCRDWPVHKHLAHYKGTCGKCGQTPQIINQPYSPHPNKFNQTNTPNPQ